MSAAFVRPAARGLRPRDPATTSDSDLESGSDSARLPARHTARGSNRDARSAFVTAVCAAVIGYVVLSAVLVGVGMFLIHVLLHGSIGRWDESASRWLADHRVSWLNQLAGAFGRLADTLGVMIVAAATEVVLFVRRRRREMSLFVVGLAVELGTFLTVNWFVDRPRPDVHRLGSLPTTTSYPSGHVAATLVLYTLIAVCLARFGRSRALHTVAWTVAIVLPLLVGFARVYQGMHHVSDVIGGALLGIGAVRVALVAVPADERPAAGSEA